MSDFKKKENKKSRLGVALIASLVMLFSCACKKEETSVIEEDSHVPGEEYAYVAEIQELDRGDIETGALSTVVLSEDKMYYEVFSETVKGVEYRNLENPQEKTEIRFSLEEKGKITDVGPFNVDREGNVYIIWEDAPLDENGEALGRSLRENWLGKYDQEGNLLESISLAEVRKQCANDFIRQLLVDEEGVIYITAGDRVFVYNEKGKLENTIQVILDYLFLMEENRVFGMNFVAGGPFLTEIDGKKGEVKEKHGNVPGHNGYFVDGRNGKVLFVGSTKLFEYDLEMKESVEVFDWVDADVNSNNITALKVLEDGRLVVICDDYLGNPEIIYLTKTPKSQISQKEIVTLATLTGEDSDLQRVIIRFNRSSEKYRVEIKPYYVYGYDKELSAYEDALTLLHMDIVNGEAPDIISLQNMDMYNLADSRALEDLTPYLENSDFFSVEDFEKNILEAYQVNGAQITIPRSVVIKTLMGKSSLVGEKSGWTIGDMAALQEEYPNAMMIWQMPRSNALKMCLQYSWEGFVDEETGNTFFDSPEFVQVLEFTKSFSSFGGYVPDAHEALQKKEILLLEGTVSSVATYQGNLQFIGEEVTGIGYPTVDGTPASTITTESDCYAISTRSDCKEGAWAFIENVLMEDNLKGMVGFPSRTDLLEQMFTEAMVQEYETDANGDVLLDEEGKLIKVADTMTWEGFTMNVYAATEEEIAGLKKILQAARADGVRSQAVLDIVQEEAGAYFAGQKSAEDVAEIIQRRVQIYVSENR